MENKQGIQTAIELFQSGSVEESKKIVDNYLISYPNDVNANLLSAAISAAESDFLAVVVKCRKVLEIDSSNIRASYNAAVASDNLNNYQDTLAFALQILQVDPASVPAKIFQANALYNLGKVNQCIQLLEDLPQEKLMASPALSVKLAECYMSVSGYEKAIIIFKNNIAANINTAECFHNIGVIEDRRGNTDVAIKACQSAISIKSDSFNTRYNLAFLFNKKGDKKQALKLINQCFEVLDSPKIRQAYVEILSTVDIKLISNDIMSFICNVIADDVTDAQTLATIVFSLLKNKSSIFQRLVCLSINDDYAEFVSEFSQNSSSLLKQELLQLSLSNLPITNYTFECFVKMLRRTLLDSYEKIDFNDERVVELCLSVAVRSYIDGYVFTVTQGEKTKIEGFLQELINHKSIHKNKLSLLLMYVSLYEIYKKSNVNLAGEITTKTFEKLVKLQLDDNLTEEKLRSTMESMSEITDQISLTVQNQYESNPYPVWQTLSIRQPEPVENIIQKVSNYSSEETSFLLEPEILIAGCGTGSHAIQTAMRVQHKSLTAIDLSVRSLAFAKRKAEEYGFKYIDFKQLDILKVTELNKKFDIIESVGVLHHMNNPLDGFKSLVNILKPDGLMNIGLYSKLGRRFIIKAKSIYDDSGRHVSDDEIRQFRIDIMDSSDIELATNISGYKDFYALHDCRDLIFHENENNYNISDIATLIDEAGLQFIGFDLWDLSVVDKFINMFPEEGSLSDLKKWAIFEEKYPDTFSSMYIFWCRKK